MDPQPLKICEFGSWVSIAQPKQGNEVYLYQVSRELARRRHQVDLFILGDEQQEENLDGIHVHYVPMPWLLRKLTKVKLTRGLLYALKIPNAIKMLFGLLPSLAIASWEYLKHADVALVHYADEIFPLLAARILGRPSVLVTSALHTVWARQLRSILPLPSYYARLSYSYVTDFLGYWLADVVLVTSEQERAVALDTWKHLPADKVQVSPNAVDTEAFHPDREARAQVRAQLHVPDSAIVVGFASGMRKDMTNLAAARYILHSLRQVVWQDFPDTYFLIVGDHAPGSLNPPDDGRVIVTGFVDRLPPYLNAFDITIAPYDVGRGAKLKTIEAMSCGKIVVATPQAIRGFAVTNGKNAIVCEFDDFPQTLQHTIANYATLSAMGQHARELVETHYSWQGAGLHLTNVLEELRANNPRRKA
jgi:glycosyltransferase involved in cell wall biosynthesis